MHRRGIIVDVRLPFNLSPFDYAEMRRQGIAHTLIDVREPWEHALARIEGSLLRPLGEVERWAGELDREACYVLMCHHGVRSLAACQYLRHLGFSDVHNLDGGIDAWSRLIDPGVRRY